MGKTLTRSWGFTRILGVELDIRGAVETQPIMILLHTIFNMDSFNKSIRGGISLGAQSSACNYLYLSQEETSNQSKQ